MGRELTDHGAQCEAVRFGAMHEATGGPWKDLFAWWIKSRHYINAADVEAVRGYAERLAAHRSE